MKRIMILAATVSALALASPAQAQLLGSGNGGLLGLGVNLDTGNISVLDGGLLNGGVLSHNRRNSDTNSNNTVNSHNRYNSDNNNVRGDGNVTGRGNVVGNQWGNNRTTVNRGNRYTNRSFNRSFRW